MGKDGDAHYMEATMAASEKAIEQVRLHEQQELRVAKCVLADPDKITGLGQGNDTFRYLYEPMIAHCNRLRDQYEVFLRRLVQMFVDIARKVGPEKVVLPLRAVQAPTTSDDPETGTKSAKPTTTFEKRILGDAAHLRISWGPYFKESIVEQELKVATAANAKREGLIQQRTAVRYVANIFDVGDIDAEAEAVETELLESVKRDQMRYADPMATGNEDDDSGDTSGGGGGNRRGKQAAKPNAKHPFRGKKPMAGVDDRGGSLK